MEDSTEFDPMWIFNQLCMDTPETHAVFSLDPAAVLVIAEDTENLLGVLLEDNDKEMENVT